MPWLTEPFAVSIRTEGSGQYRAPLLRRQGARRALQVPCLVFQTNPTQLADQFGHLIASYMQSLRVFSHLRHGITYSFPCLSCALLVAGSARDLARALFDRSRLARRRLRSEEELVKTFPRKPFPQ